MRSCWTNSCGGAFVLVVSVSTGTAHQHPILYEIRVFSIKIFPTTANIRKIAFISSQQHCKSSSISLCPTLRSRRAFPANMGGRGMIIPGNVSPSLFRHLLLVFLVGKNFSSFLHDVRGMHAASYDTRRGVLRSVDDAAGRAATDVTRMLHGCNRAPPSLPDESEVSDEDGQQLQCPPAYKCPILAAMCKEPPAQSEDPAAARAEADALEPAECYPWCGPQCWFCASWCCLFCDGAVDTESFRCYVPCCGRCGFGQGEGGLVRDCCPASCEHLSLCDDGEDAEADELEVFTRAAAGEDLIGDGRRGSSSHGGPRGRPPPKIRPVQQRDECCDVCCGKPPYLKKSQNRALRKITWLLSCWCPVVLGTAFTIWGLRAMPQCFQNPAQHASSANAFQGPNESMVIQPDFTGGSCLNSRGCNAWRNQAICACDVKVNDITWDNMCVCGTDAQGNLMHADPKVGY